MVKASGDFLSRVGMYVEMLRLTVWRCNIQMARRLAMAPHSSKIERVIFFQIFRVYDDALFFGEFSLGHVTRS